MKVFDVYQHPQYGFEAVPRGFSWSAFLVPSVWATWRCPDFTGLMVIAWSTLMFDVARLLLGWFQNPPLLVGLLVLLVAVFGLLPGICGYRWQTDRLRRDRYDWKYTVAAKSRRRAIAAARRGRFSGKVLLANGG